MSASGRGWVRAIALGVAVLTCDQITKAIAASALDPGEHVSIGLGFQLTDVRNRGIAFGLLSDGQGLVIAVTAAALARPGLWVGVGLLLGGALGNLADRMRADEVTDFIDPPLWPAFNVADIAITVGILVIILVHRPMKESDPPMADAEATEQAFRCL